MLSDKEFVEGLNFWRSFKEWREENPDKWEEVREDFEKHFRFYAPYIPLNM